MAVLALILSVTAVLVAVGGIADKFSANPERDDRWRLVLIGLFVRFDETVARLRPAELKSRLLTLLCLTLFIGVCLVLPLYFLSDLMPWAERFYTWLFGPRWGHWFTIAAYYDSLFRAGVDAIALGIAYVAALGLVLSAAYGATLLLLIKVLNIASSPKASPLAFLLGMLGITVALGKVIVDAAKLL